MENNDKLEIDKREEIIEKIIALLDAVVTR